MINISIFMGIAYWLWANGTLSMLMGRAQSQYTLLEESKDETIVVENVWFRGTSNKTITIFVRNVGSREAVIKAVYLNGTQVAPGPSLPRTVYVSGNLTLTVIYSWSYGQMYVISVATSRGNQATGEWFV
jgi:hypothetical protein